MEIKFKTLTLRNFLSYGNVPTVFSLDKPGTCLIQGEDLDNVSQGRMANGCGKSALINGLCYALYDKPISNISKDNLVNNVNKQNMEVIVEFQKGDDDYTIKRVRKEKSGAGGNYVQFFINGKDKTPDSSKNTNALIQSIIGIPYELFIRIVVFSANHTPFLDMPLRSHYAANQTDIIEELFDLKKLSEMALSLKEQIKEAEQNLEMKKQYVDQLKKEHERHEHQLNTAKQRVDNWNKQNKQEIKDIEQKLEQIHNVDIEQQRDLHEKLKNTNKDLKQALDEQRAVESELKKLNKQTKKNDEELDHLKNDKCPYCLQQYIDSDEKIKEIEDKSKELNQSIDSYSKELQSIDKTVETLSNDYSNIKEQITVENIDELLNIKNKKDVYEQKVEELKNTENPFIDPLKELEETQIEEIDMDEINELTTHIEHQKFLQKLLTKRDSFVRKSLLNKHIPYLNKRLAHYLNQLGLPHIVEFTHEMTANISQFGRPLDFGNLSNGQRARVNIALSFAFRDVLQSMHNRINVCMLDEVLDVGLDTIGVQNAAKMLKQMGRDEGITLYVITHRDEIDNFDSKINIQMSKGFSYVKEE